MDSSISSAQVILKINNKLKEFEFHISANNFINLIKEGDLIIK